jgi:hypothetical protein
MSRLPDWEHRLFAFIAEHRDRPFQWGSWDCALFATACAAEITGEDRAAAFRDRYSDKAGAMQALRDVGSGTLLRTLDSLYPRKAMPFAGRGDLVWFKGCVGVCLGADTMFIEEGESGLTPIPRALCSKAWSV